MGLEQVVFFDHGLTVTNSDDTVAGLVVQDLVASAAGETVEIGAAPELCAPSSKAVVHVTDDELTDFCERRARSGLHTLALRVTTGRNAGSEHVVSESAVVLSVRRMAAMADAQAWASFLRASESELRAIAGGDYSKVSLPVKPILRLFVEKEDALPALQIMCAAFEEVHHLARSKAWIWEERARATQDVDWWRAVLDEVQVIPQDRTAEGAVRWGIARVTHPEGAVQMLLERLATEALQWSGDVEGALEPLLEAIFEGDAVDIQLVKSAARALTEVAP